MFYLWRCDTCGTEVEVERTYGTRDVPPDLTEHDHPAECAEQRWTRLISKTSFALKGGGWYREGYDKRRG